MDFSYGDDVIEFMHGWLNYQIAPPVARPLHAVVSADLSTGLCVVAVCGEVKIVKIVCIMLRQ